MNTAAGLRRLSRLRDPHSGNCSHKFAFTDFVEVNRSINIEQAIFVRDKQCAAQERGASEGLASVASDWRAEAAALCAKFGEPRDGIACPLAIFAQPLSWDCVAVVQAADLPDARLGFRMLFVPRHLYSDLIRDPFTVSDRFPPDWKAQGPLAALAWLDERPPRRTVAQLQKVLETGGSPTLLGAVQALVDGGRVVFERATPASQLIRDVWQLLPSSVQGELWPATFAFSNDLRFDLLVVPKIEGLDLDRYVTEERAVDYPEGRFEFGLQYAIEHGDQAEVDRLLNRRSGKQFLRTAIFVLIFGVVAYLGVHVLFRFL
jgi:hypothetical protein